jgi:hypothetical protein
MTSQGNGEPAEYQVIVSEQVGVLIKQAHREAAQRGQGKPFVVALRTIQRRLQKDPHVFGEPLFHLPALKLLVYHAVVPPLVVHYALHQERPLAIVRSVELLG